MDFVWLYQTLDGGWLPFRKSDQLRLESLPPPPASHDAGDAGDAVPVHGGRWEVHRSERQVLERYGDESVRAVRRSLWYRKTETGLEPYDEVESEQVEEVYQTLKAALDTKGVIGQVHTVPVGDGQRQIRLEVRGWSRQIEVQEEDGAELEGSPSSWFSRSSVQVQRGFGEISSQLGEPEEELLSKAVSHYFILTHGLGEKFSQKMGQGLAGAADDLRQSLFQSLLLSAGYSKSGERWEALSQVNEDRPPKCDVIPLEWWQCFHSDEMDSRLEDLTLPSLGMVREVANCALSDAIFYMQNRTKLLDLIHEKLEKLVAQIRRHNPGFTGNISLIGHSLGGVIFFDLLNAHKALSFKPKALITLGSPTALFIHCSHTQTERSVGFLKDIALYNIFHPLDPVAYRMEPLFSARFRDIAPERIPKVFSRTWPWTGTEAKERQLSRWGGAQGEHEFTDLLSRKPSNEWVFNRIPKMVC